MEEMEGKKEKEVIIVTAEEGETPRRSHRVGVVGVVTAASRAALHMMGVSLMWGCRLEKE